MKTKALETHPSCPKCGYSEKVVKNGKARGKSRFLCNACKHYFMPVEIITERIPKFNFLDIKMLCILLYFSDYDVKEIFEYIIKPVKSDMLTYKIIYRWINEALNKDSELSCNRKKKPKPIIIEIKIKKEFDSKIKKIITNLKHGGNILILTFGSNKNIQLIQPSPVKISNMYDDETEVVQPRHTNRINNTNPKLELLKSFIDVISLNDATKIKILKKDCRDKEIAGLQGNKSNLNYKYINYFENVLIHQYSNQIELLPFFKWGKKEDSFAISFDDNFNSMTIIDLIRK